MSKRHAAVTGEEVQTRLARAKTTNARGYYSTHSTNERTYVEKAIREKFLSHLPGQPEIAAGAPINFSLDVAAAIALERNRLQDN